MSQLKTGGGRALAEAVVQGEKCLKQTYLDSKERRKVLRDKCLGGSGKCCPSDNDG